MITFQAKFIHASLVKKMNKSYNFEDEKVAFVTLEPISKNDLTTIFDLANEWGNLDSYAFDIKKSMVEDEFASFFNIQQAKKYYALTTQKTDYSVLDSNKILGIAEVEKIDAFKSNLNFIQSNPEHMYGSNQAKYKHIGQALIQGIVDLQNNNSQLVLKSIYQARKFYEKIGFKKLPQKNFYVFKKNG